MPTIQPPIAKIYEAYSAVADQRVHLDTQQAIVFSSDLAKGYTVRFKANEYSANDNATYWQHYAGYPIIATLIVQHRLPLLLTDLTAFKNINWHQLNATYHRDYDQAISAFLAQQTPAVQAAIQKSVQQTQTDLAALPLTIKRNRAKMIQPSAD